MAALSSSPILQYRRRASRDALRSTSTNAYYTRIKQDVLHKPGLDVPSCNSGSLSHEASPPPPQQGTRSDSVRKDDCSVCYRSIPLSDMSAHRRQHHLGQKLRLNRVKAGVCKNTACGRTLDAIDLNGVMVRPSDQDSELCGLCHKQFMQFYSWAHNHEGQMPSNRDFDCQSSRPTDYGSEMVLDHSGGNGPLWKQREGVFDEKTYARYLQYKNRTRKDRGKDGKEVWPDHLEEAFQIALCKVPHIGKRKTMAFLINKELKSCGRNELLAKTLQLMTGIKRTRKQISSHIQVLQGLIKDPKCKSKLYGLTLIKSESSKDAGEAPKGLQYDNVTGNLIITKPSSFSNQHNRSTTTGACLLGLPPPTNTLGSSTPPQHPFMQKIELNMSVFSPEDLHRPEGLACHTYTRIQDEMGTQARSLEDDDQWRMLYPDLADILNSGFPLKSEVILLESSIELMTDYSPPKSSLAIHLFADVACTSPDASWRYQTRFYTNGSVSQVCSGLLLSDNTQYSVASKTRMNIPLSSSWWVTIFHDFMERRCAIKMSGDARQLYQHEQQTRQDIGGISVMQEIFVDQNTGINSLDCGPAFILLWKFRQTQASEAATTSWGKLHLPPLRAAAFSPMPPTSQPPTSQPPTSQPPTSQPPTSQPPITLESTLHSYQSNSYLPLLRSQIPLPPPLQNGTKYDEWPQPSVRAFPIKTRDITADFKAESPITTAFDSYSDDDVLQGVSAYTQVSGDHDGSNYIDNFEPRSTSHSTVLESQQFVGQLQDPEYELHSFGGHEQAAFTLSELANQPIVADTSRPSAVAESASQSTSRTSFTSFSTNNSTVYLQDATDSNLELDVANWNIQLQYEEDHEQMEMEMQRQSPIVYKGIGLNVSTTSMELDVQGGQQLSIEKDREQPVEQTQGQQHQPSYTWPYGIQDEHDHEALVLAQEYHAYNLSTYSQNASRNEEPGDQACHTHRFASEDGHWTESANVDGEGDMVPDKCPHPLSPETLRQQHRDHHKTENFEGLTHLPSQVTTHDPHMYAREMVRHVQIRSPDQVVETVQQYRAEVRGDVSSFQETENGLRQSHGEVRKPPRFLPMDIGEEAYGDGIVKTECQVAELERGHVLGEVG
ncbi:hypothetical protein MMC13_007914 [Lambiella insularis]|nr:hypothetical protein [Lambiella insularis]